jgi:4-hydroxy-4-methyl-2-oxoglutarate aldolase
MPENAEKLDVLAIQARWDKIRVANAYDTLLAMGYPNQCLDLRIRPLFPNQHLAGKAVPMRGSRDPRSREEMEAGGGFVNTIVTIRQHLFPGSVVVVEGGGDYSTGKFGEMTSWNLQQSGAKGIVLDSYIRDKRGLEIIPDFTTCAIGTSPVESLGRWYPQHMNVPISLPGATSTYVRVDPGDWIVGGSDGVLVIPQKIAAEALEKAEDVECREQGMREDLAAGMLFDDAFAKWGRA